VSEDCFTSDDVTYRWRGEVTDVEMVELVDAHGGNAEAGWWDRIRSYSWGASISSIRRRPVVGFAEMSARLLASRLE
jgi:hypothetical protein